MSARQDPSRLSPSQVLTGRRVFLLGGTGFLGKVTLAMLLDRFPGIGRVYVMVRAGSGTTSEQRFWADVVASPVFEPLRQRYGAALRDFITDKVKVVGGDITLEHLGYSEQEAQAIADDLDVIVNSSGKVTFNPALDQSLRTNVGGTKNIIAFAKRMKRPALVHVSTCFVAGNRSGEIWESESVDGFFPRRSELRGATFDVEREIADCARLAEHVREEADDAVLAAELLKTARERLREEGRDPDNERYLRLAQARERKNWIRDRLTQLGIERAQRWGWPNIYCYSKSLAEQLVARETGIVRAIVRPSIVESAVSFPFPGWNEGFTTTAPLIFLALKGQNLFLAEDKLILDLTPVDHIAGGLLSVAAAACVEQPELVYQLASGDTNPSRMRQIVTLLGLHKRRHFEERDQGPSLVNQLLSRMEARPASADTFARTSAPMLAKAAKHASRLLERARPAWGAPRLAEALDQIKQRVDRLEQVSTTIDETFEMYRPFTVQNQYIFRTDHIRALQASMDAAERELLPWKVAEIDWHDYWLNIHFPGLHKWVLPELEKDFAAKPRTVFTYNTLVELLETAAKLHGTRVAMRIEREGHDDRYTYAELKELAGRVAAFLHHHGVVAGERVMLVSENRPEWAMCYFGVIQVGAACIPVDKDSTLAELLNLARSGEACGLLVSEQVLAKHPGLADALRESAVATKVWSFADVFALDEAVEREALATLPRPRLQSNALASLIFTSGTTGHPKGVMLSQRNFTTMTSELSTVFEMTSRDGMLSVLPLHHTFEFSAGLLMPLAHGAQITYLDELTGDAIGEALRERQTTAIVGVPALWELLQRRMRQTVRERADWAPTLFDGLVKGHLWLRERGPFNLGLLLFWPLHQRLGGRIRYLISGGSALSDDVKRFFHGLGFAMLEGYGLTEAAPVLTVTRPGQKLLAGSAGQALPHVELKIVDPDPHGVGEVAARGATIMAGYFGNEAATNETLRDGWLHTGDLGYLDDERNLHLVGRSKDVIVDSNGKNVYPDELEELYGSSPLIKELSVVGLPDGAAERVAALVVPDYEQEPGVSHEELRERVREHLRLISLSLPYFKRIKVTQLTDEPLPRTATRKIKRPDVVRALRQTQKQQNATSLSAAERAEHSGHDAHDDGHDWLLDLVTQVSGRPRSRITNDTRLDQLGFDSLMYSELGTAIESAGGHLVGIGDVTEIDTVRGLISAVRRHHGDTQPSQREEPRTRATDSSDRESAHEQEIKVPALVATLGTRALDAARQLSYSTLLDCRFDGRSNIPQHTTFIVAANHSSHVDIGLARLALEDRGKQLYALAAADYFFDTRLKRACFENFTHLVPIDRSGSLRRSLRQALDLLRQGYDLLIFPEGTRSVDGQIKPFKASLGYLAMHARVGILPLYLWGTHEVLPKGSYMLKGRDVGAKIGALLSYEQLTELVKGVPRSEGYRLVSLLVQRQIENMRDGTTPPRDIEALRPQLLEQLRQEAE